MFNAVHYFDFFRSVRRLNIATGSLSEISAAIPFQLLNAIVFVPPTASACFHILTFCFQ